MFMSPGAAAFFVPVGSVEDRLTARVTARARVEVVADMSVTPREIAGATDKSVAPERGPLGLRLNEFGNAETMNARIAA
jgi:hypothetical protein